MTAIAAGSDHSLAVAEVAANGGYVVGHADGMPVCAWLVPGLVDLAADFSAEEGQ